MSSNSDSHLNHALKLLDPIKEQMAAHVEPFINAITLIKPGDDRTPPGDHNGTGAFVSIRDDKFLITCEHVARERHKGVLALTVYGAVGGVSIEGRFDEIPLPEDVALSSISEHNWNVPSSHFAKAIPLDRFATEHKPVEHEFLYVYGFPGIEAVAFLGVHQHYGVGIFSQECEFDELVKNEEEKADANYHFCMDFNPERAVLLSGKNSPLANPEGMSGSLIWNTRFVEKSSRGEAWSPEDAQVTGIVWGHSSKRCMLIATRIEHIHAILDLN